MLFRLYSIDYKYTVHFFYTPCPQVDKSFWDRRGKEIVWLSNPLPFGRLVPLAEKLSTSLRSPHSLLMRVKDFLGIKKVHNDLSEEAREYFGKVILPSIEEKKIIFPAENLMHDVVSILKGRILLPEEVTMALQERSIILPLATSVIMQLLYLAGEVEILPALTVRKDIYRCLRCGETKKIIKVKCADCGEDECAYCDVCVGMGQARTCQVLYAIKGMQERMTREVSFNLDFSLTLPQEHAFKAASDFAVSKYNVGLIWAACGAGKTEVSFGAIREELQKGGKVLYAIPRKDVVAELEPRLRRAFPATIITALYGGSKNKYQEGELVIATTHQCLRFYRDFSLVVLDEADAFPFEGNEMLYLAVERARQEGGKILYMSATPSEKMLKDVKRGELQLITVPARHHGYPLPEPRLIIDNMLFYPRNDKKIRLPHSVIEFINKSIEENNAQVFVFVPTVAIAEPVAVAIREALKDKSALKITFSHARDSERDAKRTAFSRGEINIFVTTSIMERGITVERANVLVLYADFSKIYSWRTLIQMAGRAGRTAQYPNGDVCFIASTKTEEMEKAVKSIRKMNAEAKQKGYLTD